MTSYYLAKELTTTTLCLISIQDDNNNNTNEKTQSTKLNVIDESPTNVIAEQMTECDEPEMRHVMFVRASHPFCPKLATSRCLRFPHQLSMSMCTLQKLVYLPVSQCDFWYECDDIKVCHSAQQQQQHYLRLYNNLVYLMLL